MAVTSMSQPGGTIPMGALHLPRKYRVYLCSSPIISAMEALSISITILLTKLVVGRPWRNTVRFVVYRRFSRKQGEDDDVHTWPTQSTWSRAIFFIVGTLPALVKLASFSGVPWSKAWGLMFGISYLLTEGTTMLCAYDMAGQPRSESDALGFSDTDWQLDAGKVARNMLHTTDTIQDNLNITGMLISMLAHFGLALSLSHDLWSYWLPQYDKLSAVQLNITVVVDIVIAVLSVSYILLQMTWGTVRRFVKTRMRRLYGLGDVYGTIFFLTLSIPLSLPPSNAGTLPIKYQHALRSVSGWVNITVLLRLVVRMLNRALKFLCTRYLRLAKILLVVSPYCPFDRDPITKFGRRINELIAYQKRRSMGQAEDSQSSSSLVSPEADQTVIQGDKAESDETGGATEPQIGTEAQPPETSSTPSLHTTFDVAAESPAIDSEALPPTQDGIEAEEEDDSCPESNRSFGDILIRALGLDDLHSANTAQYKKVRDIFFAPATSLTLRAKIATRITEVADRDKSCQDFDQQEHSSEADKPAWLHVEYEVDGVGVGILACFCVQVALTIMWYATIYSPVGTVNPDWTDVFG